MPELRAKGADIVVALLHGGLDSAAYSPTMENPACTCPRWRALMRW